MSHDPEDTFDILPPAEACPKKVNFYPPTLPGKVAFRGRQPVMNEEMKMRYLHELRKWGTHYKAAEFIGVTSQTVLKARKEDDEFSEACDETKNRFSDELIHEALRRAINGTLRPIVGGKDRDEIITYEVVHSDKLLEFLIKGARPEYRESAAAELSKLGQQGGVVAVPTAPLSPADWEKQLGAMANPSDAPEVKPTAKRGK